MEYWLLLGIDSGYICLNNSTMKQENIQVKLDWVVNWMKANQYADVMNSKLVDEYEEEFKVKIDVMMFGANKCKDLGKTLSYGYKIGLFKRKVFGLTNGAWHVGFPKWVYVYELQSKQQ